MHYGELPYLPTGRTLEEVADPRVDVEREVRRRIAAEELHRQLRRLPDEERRVVEMSYGLNGYGRPLSTREIGEVLGVSNATAWRICQRGLKRLRAFYGVC